MTKSMTARPDMHHAEASPKPNGSEHHRTRKEAMPVYFVAQIQIDDDETYARYVEAAGPTFEAANARPIAVDEDVVPIEGDWHGGKTVILEFEDEAAFRAWYDSDEYQAAKAIRLPAVTLKAALVHGI